jgi:ribonucleoside-diphosphate reductase subunit M2
MCFFIIITIYLCILSIFKKMTVFDAQSELAAKNLRSVILSRLAENSAGLEPGEEPILKENSRRFCLFPIKYHEVSICK